MGIALIIGRQYTTNMPNSDSNGREERSRGKEGSFQLPLGRLLGHSLIKSSSRNRAVARVATYLSIEPLPVRPSRDRVDMEIVIRKWVANKGKIGKNR